MSLIAHVAQANATSTTSSAIDTTGATLLVAVVSEYSGQSNGVFSDSKGNAWTALTTQTQGGVRERMLYCLTPTVGNGHTFSMDGTNSFCSIAVAAFDTVNTLDQQSGNAAGNGVNTVQPGSITPGAANALLVLGVGTDASTGLTEGGGFTEADDVFGGLRGVALAYMIQTSAVAANPTVTMGFGQETGVTMASFTASGGGGGGGVAAPLSTLHPQSTRRASFY